MFVSVKFVLIIIILVLCYIELFLVIFDRSIILNNVYKRWTSINESHYASNSHLLDENIQKLLNNPIYLYFNLTAPIKREKLQLLVLITSSPRNFDRRMAVRNSWMKRCRSSKGSIECMFATDKLDPSHALFSNLQAEQKMYGDLVFHLSMSPMDFGGRLLYQLVWSYITYDYNFLLHLDDDYYLSLDRLVTNLPLYPKMIQYGYCHCLENILRVDEGFVLFSKDVILKMLNQSEEQMICHQYGDQQTSLWNNAIPIAEEYSCSTVIHHDPPAQFIPEFTNFKNASSYFIAIHGCSPNLMINLWFNDLSAISKNSEPFKKDEKCNIKNLLNDTYSCPQSKSFDYRVFQGPWFAEPHLCKEHFVWGSNQSYNGRLG